MYLKQLIMIISLSICTLSAEARMYSYDARDKKIQASTIDTDAGWNEVVRTYVNPLVESWVLFDVLRIEAIAKDGSDEVFRTWKGNGGWQISTEEEKAAALETGPIIKLNNIITGGGGTNDDIACLVPVPECNEQLEPLLIDLGQDGIHLGSPGVGIEFDYFGEGNTVQTQWVAPYGDEVFLALDSNNNGQIDNGSELFGRGMLIGTQRRANHGFEELGQYDLIFNGGNHDGVINAQDTIWQQLLLWHDLNADGQSTPDELSPITLSPLTELALTAKENAHLDPAGNALRFWAWANGFDVIGNQKYKMVDVFFAPISSK